MKNKIGINEYKLRNIEDKIVNTKLNLLDEYFTFNNKKIDFEYLKKLHDFLFNDFYYNDESGTREINEIENKIIENNLKEINYICINCPEKKKEILNLIKDIWYLQPFIVGNTRTLIAYLKIINLAFLLELNVDVNMKIKNDPSIFCLDNFVNQKRLTKFK